MRLNFLTVGLDFLNVARFSVNVSPDLHALHLLLARLDRLQIEAEIPKLALGACDQPARRLLCPKATFIRKLTDPKMGQGW